MVGHIVFQSFLEHLCNGSLTIVSERSIECQLVLRAFTRVCFSVRVMVCAGVVCDSVRVRASMYFV